MSDAGTTRQFIALRGCCHRGRVQAVPLGIMVQDFAVNTPEELNTAFGTIAAQRPQALLVIPDAATLDLGARIAGLALKNRVPVVSTDTVV
jgi:putative ABC transport system substrate-binding protein